jgi:hypothetical protein
MTPKRLRSLVDGLDHLEELVDGQPYIDSGDPCDVLLDAWRSAEAAAVSAYAEWRQRRDSAAYAVYRALADRADAAQDALAARARQGT